MQWGSSRNIVAEWITACRKQENDNFLTGIMTSGIVYCEYPRLICVVMLLKVLVRIVIPEVKQCAFSSRYIRMRAHHMFLYLNGEGRESTMARGRLPLIFSLSSAGGPILMPSQTRRPHSLCLILPHASTISLFALVRRASVARACQLVVFSLVLLLPISLST